MTDKDTLNGLTLNVTTCACAKILLAFAAIWF